MIRTVYISGPMTGYEDFNRPLFHSVKTWLSNTTSPGGEQYIVLSPADITQDETTPEGDWGFYMRQAVKMQMDAEVTLMLPGWTKSKGARREFDLAVDLNMGIWLLGVNEEGEYFALPIE